MTVAPVPLSIAGELDASLIEPYVEIQKCGNPVIERLGMRSIGLAHKCIYQLQEIIRFERCQAQLVKEPFMVGIE